jgi:hypothetical protein
LQFGQDFQDDEVGIELSVVLRDLPLPIGVVESVVDQLRRNAEAGGLVAVDRDLELRRIGQEITRRVGKLRQRAELLQHLLRPLDQFVDVGILQRVLVAAASDPGAHVDILRRGQEHVGAGDLGELGPQPVDDLPRRRGALRPRLEHNGKAAGMTGLGLSVLPVCDPIP